MKTKSSIDIGIFFVKMCNCQKVCSVESHIFAAYVTLIADLISEKSEQYQLRPKRTKPGL